MKSADRRVRHRSLTLVRADARVIEPLTERLGPIDVNAIVAIIGFDAGGPLHFRTFWRDRNDAVVTYVSCELAPRPEQRPNALGRYELVAPCDSEEWARSVLTDIDQMSMSTAFDENHTMDIGGWVNDGLHQPPLQGVLFKEESRSTIDGHPYGILRVIGITRPEKELARSVGGAPLVRRLSEAF